MASEGAAAAILDGHGRLLLVRESYDRRRHTLPGGAVEDGESPLDAVVRETLEETGVTIEIEHLVGVYRLVGGRTVFVFSCIAVDGAASLPDTGEIAAVAWLAPDRIPEPKSNILHHALADIVARRRGVVHDGLPRIN